MADFKGEKLVNTLKTKKVYDYVDTEKGISQVSRELYLNKDLIIHYPRGFDGGNKYKTIKRFHFIGFKGKLPVGVFKSATFGWGFTKPLNPFTDFLNSNYDFVDVIIEKNGPIKFDITNKKIQLNEKCLASLLDSFTRIFKKNKSAVDFVLQINLHNLFPTVFSEPTKTYIADALASSLESWGNNIDEFSIADKNAIKDLFDKLSIGTDYLTSEALAKTKELVDSKYIQATLKKI